MNRSQFVFQVNLEVQACSLELISPCLVIWFRPNYYMTPLTNVLKLIRWEIYSNLTGLSYLIFAMYYTYGRVQAIPTCRAYQLYCRLRDMSSPHAIMVHIYTQGLK